MSGTFSGCQNLTNIDVSKFNTSNVTNMSGMFGGCKELKTIYAGDGWNINKIEFSKGMFANCPNLVGGKGTKFSSEVTDKNHAIIDGGKTNPGYLTAKGISSVGALTQKAYAVMSPDNTTLTFYYDNKKASRQGTVYELNEGKNKPKWIKFDELSIAYNKNFKTVIFDESFKNARPVSCTYWFGGFRNLTKIEGINNLNTSNVTDMSWMFYGCRRLTSIDVSNFDTSKVTNMCGMFSSCENLTNLDVCKFNTSKVTNMQGMFAWCKSLTNIDLRKFNTSNVTNMSWMFYDCKSLTSIDVCNFDTSKVTDMSEMFSDCVNLTHLDVSGFNTSNVTDMSDMFASCYKLTNIDVSKFNTSNVTNMQGMLAWCQSLTNIDVSKFNTSNVTNMSGMFAWCKSLTNIDVRNFDTSKVTYMNKMFGDCESLTSIDVSNFNTSNVTNMNSTFESCKNLKTIFVGKGWNISKVKGSEDMFRNCINLVGDKGTTFDSEITDITRAKIDGGKENPGYLTAKK
jgi:surface protein